MVTEIYYYVYILKCSDNSYYVGSTDNLEQRVTRHNAGRGTKWIAARLPVKLIYHEKYESQNLATKRERQIKKWSRIKKEALISDNAEKLKKLSKAKRPQS